MTDADLTLRDEVAEVLCRVLRDEGGAPGSSIHSWRCEHPDRYGPCSCVKEVAVEMRNALLPLLARVREEGSIAGQMRHITAEVARGDVPLSESEELIAALRARISHLEAERDEALRVAPNFGVSVYERGKRDGAAEARERVEAVLRSSWADVRTHGDAARLIRAALAEPTEEGA